MLEVHLVVSRHSSSHAYTHACMLVTHARMLVTYGSHACLIIRIMTRIMPLTPYCAGQDPILYSNQRRTFANKQRLISTMIIVNQWQMKDLITISVLSKQLANLIVKYFKTSFTQHFYPIKITITWNSSLSCKQQNSELLN